MTLDSFLALPMERVFVVRLLENDALAALREAAAALSTRRYDCALLVRDAAPAYAVLHLADLCVLVTNGEMGEWRTHHDLETRVTWHDGVTDVNRAWTETAIVTDGFVEAVAVAPSNDPEPGSEAHFPDDDAFAFESALPAVHTPAPEAPTPAPTRSEGSFSRTPHIDIDPPEPLAAGQTITAMVYLDSDGFRAGEHGEEVEISGDEALLDVYLYASPHFRVLGSDHERLFVERQRPKSAQLAFGLEVLDTAAGGAPGELDPSAGSISALFLHRGRPCGRVQRRVALVAEAAAAIIGPATAPARFEVDAQARSADLQITVVADPINNGRQFHCIVHSPALGRTVEGPWNLNDRTATIVAGYMHRFTRTGLGNAQRLAALRGAGIQLFAAAPAHFKDLFWQIIDDPNAMASFRTIGICSEDPFIPWELMVPQRTRGGERETRLPLGVEFAVGRSTRRDSVAPPQRIDLSRSLVVAPDYPGRRRLEKAQEEADMICRDFDGRRVTPAVYEQLGTEFLNPENRDVTLIHFACHGEAESSDGQIIHLEQDEQLSSIDVAGDIGFEQLFADARPVVFLNACEVGRPVSALVGIGGFADVFLDLGAKAVVAPLWSVKDTIAHEIATEFYAELKKALTSGVPCTFAEILRDIRARAYRDSESRGEDTYAAYCFYGDPLAEVRKGSGGTNA